VEAFADDSAVARQDRADHGIRAGEGFAATSQLKGAGDPIFLGTGRKWE
jgi:hypothetical protein